MTLIGVVARVVVVTQNVEQARALGQTFLLNPLHVHMGIVVRVGVDSMPTLYMVVLRAAFQTPLVVPRRNLEHLTNVAHLGMIRIMCTQFVSTKVTVTKGNNSRT